MKLRKEKPATTELPKQVEPQHVEDYLAEQRLRVSDLADLEDDDQAQAVLRDRLHGEQTPYSNDQLRAIGADVSGKSNVSPSTAARAALEAEARAEAYNRWLADRGLSTRGLPRPKRIRELRRAAEVAERELERAEKALERFDRDPTNSGNAAVTRGRRRRLVQNIEAADKTHGELFNVLHPPIAASVAGWAPGDPPEVRNEIVCTNCLDPLDASEAYRTGSLCWECVRTLQIAGVTDPASYPAPSPNSPERSFT